jgi:hypothetical protein
MIDLLAKAKEYSSKAYQLVMAHKKTAIVVALAIAAAALILR